MKLGLSLILLCALGACSQGSRKTAKLQESAPIAAPSTIELVAIPIAPKAAAPQALVSPQKAASLAPARINSPSAIVSPNRFDQPTPATLDAETQEPVEETKQVLTDRNLREKAVEANEQTRELDRQLDSMVGSGSGKDDMYGLAADVFQKLSNETGGDPTKIQKILQDFQKNPEAFGNSLTPAQKAAIHNIAEQIERRKK